jgi:topoisomerase-4 subunit A
MSTAITPRPMRYTEARLTPAAIELMAGLDEGTVDFRPTYNGEEEEPEVFPGLFPNLLANGASGIAVGMATSIPPHNVAEIIDAAIHLIDNPGAEPALMEFVSGPDFPTGGIIVDSAEAIAAAYATGRGSFRVRARWTIEDQGRGHLDRGDQRNSVPGAQGKLIEQIAGLIADKKLPILADVRDESDAEIRIVIEPRSRTVDPQMLMESLFRLTDLEVGSRSTSTCSTPPPHAAGDGPQGGAVGLARHQFEVLVRRSQHRIARSTTGSSCSKAI